MKSCAEYEKLLHLEVYNELDRAEKEALTAHLKGCPACRREREGLQRFVTGIHGAALLPRLSPTDAAGMRASIIEKAMPVSFGGRCRQWLASLQLAPILAAACLVLMVWGGLTGYDTYFRETPRQIALHESEKKMLMENYEVINNLELLEDMEFLEKLVQVTDASEKSTDRFRDRGRERNNQVHQNHFSGKRVV